MDFVEHGRRMDFLQRTLQDATEMLNSDRADVIETGYAALQELKRIRTELEKRIREGDVR